MIEELDRLITTYRWTCDDCGAVTEHPGMIAQREAETQHNSPRKSHTRGGVSRSPCEANRIDAAGIASL